MIKIITDIEFIKSIIPEIQDDYEEAKKLFFDAPREALAIVRKINDALIEKIFRENPYIDIKYQDSNMTIFDKIKLMEKQSNYSRKTINDFHTIRDACNKALHPEKQDITKDKLNVLAEEVLRLICKIVLNVFAENSNQKYDFITNEIPLLKDLLYSAIIENNLEAKTKAGRILASNWHIRKGEKNEINDPKMIIGTSDHHHNIAYELLNDAAKQNEPEAIFLLGKFHWQRMFWRKKEKIDHEEFVLRAAQFGHDPAKAYWAVKKLLTMDGEINTELSGNESQQAFLFSKELALKNPECAYIMHKAHSIGYLVDENSVLSDKYLKIAANLGHRHSQYQLAQIYVNNHDLASYDKYLQLSANSGYKPALLELLKNPRISYKNKVYAYDFFSAFDFRPIHGEKFILNQEPFIELEYARLVIKNNSEPVRISNSITRLHNFLQLIEPTQTLFDEIKNLIATAMRNAQFTYEDLMQHTVAIVMLDLKNREREQQRLDKLFSELETFSKKLVAQNIKLGRNDKCHCASGKKYKSCCMP